MLSKTKEWPKPIIEAMVIHLREVAEHADDNSRVSAGTAGWVRPVGTVWARFCRDLAEDLSEMAAEARATKGDE